MKLCPMVADNAKYAPPPELSCPHAVKRNQPRLHVYPRWLLLKQRNFVHVALKTRDVGFAAFDKMRSAGKLLVMPQWAEKVAEFIDNLMWMDNSHAITLVNFVWDICNPTQPGHNPNNVYEDCLHHFVQEFLEEIFMGTRQDQLKFVEGAHLYIADMKAAGNFERKFHVTLLTILQWCDQQRNVYDETIDE
jgi:hypothetical protein